MNISSQPTFGIARSRPLPMKMDINKIKQLIEEQNQTEEIQLSVEQIPSQQAIEGIPNSASLTIISAEGPVSYSEEQEYLDTFLSEKVEGGENYSPLRDIEVKYAKVLDLLMF